MAARPCDERDAAFKANNILKRARHSASRIKTRKNTRRPALQGSIAVLTIAKVKPPFSGGGRERLRDRRRRADARLRSGMARRRRPRRLLCRRGRRNPCRSPYRAYAAARRDPRSEADEACRAHMYAAAERRPRSERREVADDAIMFDDAAGITTTWRPTAALGATTAPARMIAPSAISASGDNRCGRMAHDGPGDRGRSGNVRSTVAIRRRCLPPMATTAEAGWRPLRKASSRPRRPRTSPRGRRPAERDRRHCLRQNALHRPRLGEAASADDPDRFGLQRAASRTV